MRFFLGTHHPHWLTRAEVPLVLISALVGAITGTDPYEAGDA